MKGVLRSNFDLILICSRGKPERVLLLFSLERVVTFCRGGWRPRLLATTVVPELVRHVPQGGPCEGHHRHVGGPGGQLEAPGKGGLSMIAAALPTGILVPESLLFTGVQPRGIHPDGQPEPVGAGAREP